MTDETNSIPPALTANQWAVFDSGRAVLIGNRDDGNAFERVHPLDGGGLSIRDERADSVIVPPERLSAIAALANAALPDGDPRKITPFDVAHVAAARVLMRSDSFLARQLAALQAKLNALLPPGDSTTP